MSLSNKTMDYTLLDANKQIIDNLPYLKDIWHKRCRTIKNDLKGDYSRHLLFILNDLREEIENNKCRFSGTSGSYARKFFKLQIANYCTCKKGKINEIDKIKRKWTKKVDQELCFIVKALCDPNNSKHKLEDIPTWIESINNQITSESSFQKIIDILCEKLEKEFAFEQIEFIVDTIIILFNKRGILELDRKLDDQLQTFDDYQYKINLITYPSSVLSSNNYLIPSVWGSPLRKKGQSASEYIEKVRDYYSNLSIKQRLNFLNNVYCQGSREYKVIFNIKGWDFTEKIVIGVGEFYNPKTHNRYIENNCEINNFYSQEFTPDPNDFEIRTDSCVAINIQGIDIKSMVIKARKIAERIIGVLLTDKIYKPDVILSNDWIICNSKGEICSFYIKGAGNIKIKIDNNITSEFNKYDKDRLGQWISLENQCHQTIIKFLSSIDCYRQSVESLQISQQILNSWFAMEMFRKDSQGLPKHLPEPSEKLCKKQNIEETQGSWLSDLGTLQLILVLCKLKFNLFTTVREFADLLNADIYLMEDRDKTLIEEISRVNYRNEREWLSKILEVYPRIEEKLKMENKEIKYSRKIKEIFQENQKCEEYLFNEILELKDDVYNIYRLRNMLVHSGNTESKLLDYYAKRSLEYCDSILDIIAYKISQTSSDNEIKDLKDYFQDILNEAKIAIQSVQAGKMNEFKNWVLS